MHNMHSHLHQNKFESGGTCPAQNFVVVHSTFLALQVLVVFLVGAFVMVGIVRFVSCLLFFYSRFPRALWSRCWWAQSVLVLVLPSAISMLWCIMQRIPVRTTAYMCLDSLGHALCRRLTSRLPSQISSQNLFEPWMHPAVRFLFHKRRFISAYCRCIHLLPDILYLLPTVRDCSHVRDWLIQVWFSAEAWLGSKGPSVQIGSETVFFSSDLLRVLGVTIASDLSVDVHVARVCSHSIYSCANFDESDNRWMWTLPRLLSMPLLCRMWTTAMTFWLGLQTTWPTGYNWSWMQQRDLFRVLAS